MTNAPLRVVLGSKFDADCVTRQHQPMVARTARATTSNPKHVIYHVQATGHLGPHGLVAGKLWIITVIANIITCSKFAAKFCNCFPCYV